MERGSVQVHGTLLGFLFVGMSHQHLYFQSPNTNSGRTLFGIANEQAILHSRDEAGAHRCFDCRLTLIER